MTGLAARSFAKVHKVDPLICARCGSGIKLMAVITNPAEVATILRHLVKIARTPECVTSSADLAGPESSTGPAAD